MGLLLPAEEKEVSDEGGTVKSTKTLGHRHIYQKPNDLEDNAVSLVQQAGAVSDEESEIPLHLVG